MIKQAREILKLSKKSKADLVTYVFQNRVATYSIYPTKLTKDKLMVFITYHILDIFPLSTCADILLHLKVLKKRTVAELQENFKMDYYEVIPKWMSKGDKLLWCFAAYIHLMQTKKEEEETKQKQNQSQSTGGSYRYSYKASSKSEAKAKQKEAPKASSKPEIDYFKLFGACINDLQKIKTLFRQLAIKLHPDRGGDAQEFIEMNKAYTWAKSNHK